jgi:GxxExxY protein
MDLIEAELSERIIGCCIQVQRVLVLGFLAKVYERAMAIEWAKRALKFERQKNIPVFYGGKPGGEQRLDFLVERRVVLELKTAKEIEDVRFAMARSYCKATPSPLALVTNWARPVLEIRRLVLTA